MKIKKIPMRMCVVTKQKEVKERLLRVTKTKDQVVSVDLTGKAHGRGAYITKDIDIIKKARQKKILDKALDVNIPSVIYDKLEALCND
ncbi:MAG: RNase P modulator RnpM [Acholeplasmataceae bacterium]